MDGRSLALRCESESHTQMFVCPSFHTTLAHGPVKFISLSLVRNTDDSFTRDAPADLISPPNFSLFYSLREKERRKVELKTLMLNGERNLREMFHANWISTNSLLNTRLKAQLNMQTGFFLFSIKYLNKLVTDFIKNISFSTEFW